MLINRKAETAARLRDYGLKNFRSLAEFARALDIKPQVLTAYLNGRSLPGPKMQERLQRVGCDINWLLSGQDLSGDSATAKAVNTLETDVSSVLQYLFDTKRKHDLVRTAEKAGMDPDVLRRYVNGHRRIPIGDLIRLSEAMHDLGALQHVFRNTGITVKWNRPRRRGS